LAFYGAVCAAGVGTGMLLEVWINKKIKGVFPCYMAEETTLWSYELYTILYLKKFALLVRFCNHLTLVYCYMAEDGGIIWEMDK
jgi:hypothetical protein